MFYGDLPTNEIYTLSLHDALPICGQCDWRRVPCKSPRVQIGDRVGTLPIHDPLAVGSRESFGNLRSYAEHDRRSEEHTSELQSLAYLVCRLLLEKKKANGIPYRGF